MRDAPAGAAHLAGKVSGKALIALFVNYALRVGRQKQSGRCVSAP